MAGARWANCWCIRIRAMLFRGGWRLVSIYDIRKTRRCLRWRRQFAPLSIAAKEYMARRLVSVPVSAGDVVIRAGDPGDRFYIVADGEFDVVADGAHRKMGGGDYFGEIALLRDVPRTATVKAVVDGQLHALERADFLAAVTSHSGVRVAGEAVVEERLTHAEPLRDRG